MQTPTIIPFEKTEKRLFDLAVLKREQGEIEGSLKYLLELVDSGTDDGEVYALLGSCYFDLGLYVLSLNAWFKFLSLSLEREHARAFNAIGACYHKMDEYDTASSYFEKQIVMAHDKEFEYDDFMFDNYDSISDSVMPDFYICYPDSRVPSFKKLQQADRLANDGKYDKAIELLETIPSSSQDYSRATLLKACCYYFSGKQQKAVNMLDERIALVPDDKNAVVNVISMLISLERYDELDRYFELLKNISFESSNDNLRVAFTCIEGKREDLALFFAEKSVNLNRCDTGALHVLGLLYYNNKEFDKSLKCFRRIYNLTRSHVSEFYLNYISDAQKGLIAFRKLKYTGNVPESVKREWMKYIRNVIGGGKSAYSRCDKNEFFYILKWLYTFPNQLQSDIMFTLFDFCTPKIKAFYVDLLLDVSVSDVLKSKIITLLCSVEYKKRLPFVISGQYKSLRIAPVKFFGENSDLFLYSYSYIVGCLAVIFDNDTLELKKICENIFKHTTLSGLVGLFDDVNALSCAIATKLSFDGPFDFQLLIRLFDADADLVEKYLKIIEESMTFAE